MFILFLGGIIAASYFLGFPMLAVFMVTAYLLGYRHGKEIGGVGAAATPCKHPNCDRVKRLKWTRTIQVKR